MYKISNNVAQINGAQGRYSKKVFNPSVAYGRNAINNYKGYIKDLKFDPVELPDVSNLVNLSDDEFSKTMNEFNRALNKMKKQKMPPLDFECRYSEGEKLDTQALMGAAYESLGRNTFISTKILSRRMQNTVDELVGKDFVKMNASSLDLNKDGNIDLAEYSTSILVADALSKDSTRINPKDVDGSFTNKGENELLKYGMDSNYAIATMAYRAMYETFGLDKAQEKFLLNQNNLI